MGGEVSLLLRLYHIFKNISQFKIYLIINSKLINMIKTSCDELELSFFFAKLTVLKRQISRQSRTIGGRKKFSRSPPDFKRSGMMK